MALPYLLFTISEIRQNPNYRPRVDANGIWYPPRSLGASYITSSPTYGKWYSYMNGTLHALQSQPRNSTVYKTSSVYFDNARYWSVPYDATKSAVGNGRDDSDDDHQPVVEEGDTTYYYDWRPVTFFHPDDRSLPANLQYAGEFESIHVQRTNQAWLKKLLPSPNRAGVPKSTDSSHGGLIGDLSLLLALVAFTAKEDDVENTLATVLSVPYLPWNAPTEETGIGRDPKRGVVVTVYEMPTWRDSLEAFEGGIYGKIFA